MQIALCAKAPESAIPSGWHAQGVIRINNLSMKAQDDIRTFLRLIPRHEFGGVVYEETGEVRIPRDKEWFLFFNSPVFKMAYGEYLADYSILRPVGTTGDADGMG